jgi:DNA mismatch endonuclease (patch repair protein)
LVLRSALHRLGFRYRLGGAGLPGKPDLVLPKYRAAIFAHGCFWHVHSGCKRASLPRTNAEFWRDKLQRNVQRDAENAYDLKTAGWTVITVWECELYDDPVAVAEEVASRLRGGSPATVDYAQRAARLARSELLEVAERRVRYRLGDASLCSDEDTEGGA